MCVCVCVFFFFCVRVCVCVCVCVYDGENAYVDALDIWIGLELWMRNGAFASEWAFTPGWAHALNITVYGIIRRYQIFFRNEN